MVWGLKTSFWQLGHNLKSRTLALKFLKIPNFIQNYNFNPINYYEISWQWSLGPRSMFCTMCVQMINQAINVEVEDLVISTTITGIQWTYKILYFTLYNILFILESFLLFAKHFLYQTFSCSTIWEVYHVIYFYQFLKPFPDGGYLFKTMETWVCEICQICMKTSELNLVKVNNNSTRTT